jgi:hypothetical protein
MGILSFVAVAACASSTATAKRPTETVHVVTGPVSKINVSPTVTTAVVTLPFPLERVWRALPAAYDTVGIPLETLDKKNYLIGNTGFKLRRRLGDVALSKYLDCGRSQMGLNADEYQITLTVFTKAQPSDSGRTTITTNVDATAQGLQFSGQSSRCTSKGALERSIEDAVKWHLSQ